MINPNELSGLKGCLDTLAESIRQLCKAIVQDDPADWES